MESKVHMINTIVPSYIRSNLLLLLFLCCALITIQTTTNSWYFSVWLCTMVILIYLTFPHTHEGHTGVLWEEERTVVVASGDSKLGGVAPHGDHHRARQWARLGGQQKGERDIILKCSLIPRPHLASCYYGKLGRTRERGYLNEHSEMTLFATNRVTVTWFFLRVAWPPTETDRQPCRNGMSELFQFFSDN